MFSSETKLKASSIIIWSEPLEPDEVIYLIRIVLALAVGFVSGTLPIYWIYSVLLGIGVYGLSIPLVMALYSGSTFLSRRAAVTSGMAAYAFIWLMVWVLFYNLSV
ncbi:hypothetical protein HRbin02_00925 [Candidatus Calditenuaceae archaeon HR02]|nr:hypothetical protein HRbin02_00925 [Candidatus Calditenuaceae archaeon HR02]